MTDPNGAGRNDISYPVWMIGGIVAIVLITAVLVMYQRSSTQLAGDPVYPQAGTTAPAFTPAAPTTGSGSAGR